MTNEEITAFFRECDSYVLHVKSPGRPYVFPAFYRFLYCCGVRCAEARKLKCGDVHLGDGYIDILDTKSHRDRQLYISAELTEYLKKYETAISQCFPGREYFFPGGHGGICSASAVSSNFRNIWISAGLKRDGKVKPRAYDFRHHFACANIMRWSEEDFELRGAYTDVCTVRKIKEDKKPIEYLAPEATAAILSAYGLKTSKHRRNRMMLILLYDSGARVQELADLMVSSLHTDVANPYITLVGKGRKSRNVPLMSKTVKHLDVYLKEFHPKGDEAPLFYSRMDGRPHKLSTDSISLVLKSAADTARKTCESVPENVHCHLMRKTKAMDLYKNGVPLPFIMQLLGHESMSTTSGFYAFATLEMMSEAINKSAPKMADDEKLWKKEAVRKAIFSLD